MSQFHRILAYASLEDEAFLAIDQAAELARAQGASLSVVRVLGELSRFLRWRAPEIEPDGLRAFLEQSQREVLEERVAPLREEGLDVEVKILWGTPWLELTRCVLRDGHDLVVKAAEGAVRGKGVFFGSTALHLIRKCPCPIWVVSQASDARPRRVLAAIDPAEDATRSALGRNVLALAASLAGESGELHAASAWQPVGEILLRGRVPAAELEEHLRSTEEEARNGLAKTLAAGGEPVAPERMHVLRGDAREVLPQLVERERFDLLVMGSLGRLGIAGFLIGETAETLIRSVRCSVLVAKPPGFVSPVQLAEADQAA